jgi:transcriptional regulator with XRE-family HTH domain
MQLQRAIAASDYAAWEAAVVAGMSPTRLSRISAGRVTPSESEMASLAGVLGASKSALFPETKGGSDERAAMTRVG